MLPDLAREEGGVVGDTGGVCGGRDAEFPRVEAALRPPEEAEEEWGGDGAVDVGL